MAGAQAAGPVAITRQQPIQGLCSGLGQPLAHCRAFLANGSLRVLFWSGVKQGHASWRRSRAFGRGPLQVVARYAQDARDRRGPRTTKPPEESEETGLSRRDAPPTKTVHVLVKGLVRGIYMDEWFLNRCEVLKIDGWVKERKDMMAVEALLSGPDMSVDWVLGSIWQLGVEVWDVITSPAPQAQVPKGFSIVDSWWEEQLRLRLAERERLLESTDEGADTGEEKVPEAKVEKAPAKRRTTRKVKSAEELDEAPSSDDEAEEAVEIKPAPRAKRAAKKVVAVVEEQERVGEEEPPKKPVRKRTTQAAAATETVEGGEAAPEVKPKPRTRRKVASASDSEESDDESVPSAADAAVKPKPRTSRKAAVVASEPAEEHGESTEVVVKPTRIRRKVAAPAAPSDEESNEDAVAPKPRATRSSRSAKASQEDGSLSEGEGDSDSEAGTAEEVKKPRTRRKTATSADPAEPKLKTTRSRARAKPQAVVEEVS